MAILQKYIDQGISVNTSYNPQHFEEEKIPMSDMLKHLIMFYKYGGKQLYYFNTYDGSGEIDVDRMNTAQPLMESASPVLDEEACDSCTI
jgi:ribonucleoside-diphosphate reductase alpha chain